MKKIIILICYFGKFPIYFNLWLESIKHNVNIQFVIFTDIFYDAKIPANLTFRKISLSDLKTLFEKKLGFDISLETPYKLCDFKPAYGFLFEEYITEYDFWGYCDIDLIFGDISKFVLPKLNEYDKLYSLGHLTLYRNDKKHRELFMKEGALYNYKKVFSEPYFFAFDEFSGMMKICQKNGIREYKSEDMADISTRYSRFMLRRNTNYTYQVFYSEEGKVCRSYIVNGQVVTDEFLYLHFQKRNPGNSIQASRYFISSRGVELKAFPGEPSSKDIIELSDYSSKTKDYMDRFSYIIKKLLSFLSLPTNKKMIWAKQKLYREKI